MSGLPSYEKMRLQDARVELATKTGHLVREVVLEGPSGRVSGLVLTAAEDLKMSRWALFCPSTSSSIEEFAQQYAKDWIDHGYNLLLVQGPGDPLSGGLCSMKRLGEAQRLGIRFLEVAIGASEIVLAAEALGCALMARAILQHRFLDGPDAPRYRALQISACSRLSDLLLTARPAWQRLLMRLLDCEADLVAASRKLSMHGIEETVVGPGGASSWWPQESLPGHRTLGAQAEALRLPPKRFIRVSLRSGERDLTRLAIQAILASAADSSSPPDSKSA